jgi:cell division protein FtsI/penicillin-binding protein 2
MDRSERIRAMGFAALVLLTLGALVGRLHTVQIRDHSTLSALAKRQHRRITDLKPWRGDIFLQESERRVLVAGSVGRHSILVHGRQKAPDRLSESLAQVLGLNLDEQRRLSAQMSKGRSFYFRRRKVSHAEADALKEACRELVKTRLPGERRARYLPRLSGIEVFEEPVRLYPFGSLAAHVLGLVDIEGRGQAGVEARYNKMLEGSAGRREFEIDNRRRQLAALDSISVPALNGSSLSLTIDRRIQYHAEEALAEAWSHWQPESISLVAVEPSTGRILALACQPLFNPAEPGATPMAHLRNRALTDPYEPGSTIKPLIISHVWKAGKGHPDRPIDLPRRLKVKGRRKPIEDSHTVRVEGRETREHDVLVQSSNVGSYKLADRLTDDELRAALRAFGLGSKSMIELAGESAGNLALTRKLNTGNRAAIAQGYGLLVTPLQMALAYAAIANGGTLYYARLADALLDADGKVVKTFEPRPRARILDARVARSWMSRALADVVADRHGTARRSAIDGYSMAGKTGTSKKLVRDGKNRKRWHYSPTRTVCSFIGFAPVEAPRIAIAVVVNDPTRKHGRVFGGNVAAPIASRVLERSLKYLGVPAKPSDEAQTEQ